MKNTIKMLIKKALYEYWWKEEVETLPMISPNTNNKEEFLLKYKDLVIGELSLYNGIWTFKYSSEFKQQDEIGKLIGFPSIDKIYQSEQLWPFFTYRIPSAKRPEIQTIIKKENIDSNNIPLLLKRFGGHVATNPFELVSNL